MTLAQSSTAGAQVSAERVRSDFPILSRRIGNKPLIYLDNAATTQIPRQVIHTIRTLYSRHNANVHRSSHTLGMEATELYQQAHENVARFIGAADWREIVFVRNCTEAINLVAYTLTNPATGKYRLNPGDEVVVTVMEHHSNLVPWQMACQRSGAALRFVDIDEQGLIDRRALADAIGRRTRLVCCTHVSNVLGTINPIREIGRLAHEVGALFLVDGAQSVPHMPVSVEEMDCDFLAFSGHKMLAPTGIGVLWGRRQLMEQLASFLHGGDMIADVTTHSASWNRLPWKFEAGTPNLCGAVALAGATELRSGTQLEGAINYLQSVGMEQVVTHENDLTRLALDALLNMPGVRVYGPRDVEHRAGILAFTVDKGDAHLIAQLLNDEGIAVRSGGHCAYPLANRLQVESTVRVSFYVYNSRGEVERFLNVLEDIVLHRLA